MTKTFINISLKRLILLFVLVFMIFLIAKIIAIGSNNDIEIKDCYHVKLKNKAINFATNESFFDIYFSPISYSSIHKVNRKEWLQDKNRILKHSFFRRHFITKFYYSPTIDGSTEPSTVYCIINNTNYITYEISSVKLDLESYEMVYLHDDSNRKFSALINVKDHNHIKKILLFNNVVKEDAIVIRNYNDALKYCRDFLYLYYQGEYKIVNSSFDYFDIKSMKNKFINVKQSNSYNNINNEGKFEVSFYVEGYNYQFTEISIWKILVSKNGVIYPEKKIIRPSVAYCGLEY